MVEAEKSKEIYLLLGGTSFMGLELLTNLL
jgi:hypothetical protein